MIKPEPKRTWRLLPYITLQWLPWHEKMMMDGLSVSISFMHQKQPIPEESSMKPKKGIGYCASAMIALTRAWMLIDDLFRKSFVLVPRSKGNHAQKQKEIGDSYCYCYCYCYCALPMIALPRLNTDWWCGKCKQWLAFGSLCSVVCVFCFMAAA